MEINKTPIGFGDKFEYKGKYYWYVNEIKVKMRGNKKEDGEWVTCILYQNNFGTFAREKSEFLKRFTRCQR